MSNYVAIVLACGKSKWGWKVNKHLLTIAGEPLLLRTIRQLDELSIDHVVVTHHEDIIKIVGNSSRIFTPAAFRYYSETLLHTKPLWREGNVILSGDTAYADEVLKKVVQYAYVDNIFVHGKPFGDFDIGVTFSRKSYPLVEDACRRAIAGIEERKKAHGEDAWVGSTGPFMRALHRIDLWETTNRRDYQFFRELDIEYTQDFDRPAQYDVFLERNPWAV